MRAGYQREIAGTKKDQWGLHRTDRAVKKVICVLQSACRWEVWKQQASGNCATPTARNRMNSHPNSDSAMARHTTDAEKTLYRVGGMPHDADAASPKRIKVPLNCVR
jgi:hypothetical protein